MRFELVITFGQALMLVMLLGMMVAIRLGVTRRLVIITDQLQGLQALLRQALDEYHGRRRHDSAA